MRSVTFVLTAVLLSVGGAEPVRAQAQPAGPAQPRAAQPAATTAPATTTAAPVTTQPAAQPEVAAPAFAPPAPAPVAGAPAPAAQLVPTAPATTLDAYRAQALDIRFAPFDWKNFTLQRNGEEITGSYADAFASSPEALDQYEGARTMAVTGTVLMVIGTAAVVAGAILVPMAYNDNDSPALGWGLIGGGLAVDLVSGILVGVGAQRFNDAVELHNDALYERLRATP